MGRFFLCLLSKAQSMPHPDPSHCYYSTPNRLYGLCGITKNTPPWAHVLIDTYFANWPAQTTQELYKSKGLMCSQYWYHELRQILTATLIYTKQFKNLPHMDYYMHKYPGKEVQVATMDEADRTEIVHAFSTQLGMHWNIFPYTASDFATSITTK